MANFTPHTTSYARLTPTQSRVVLALIALIVALAVAVTLSPLASSNLKSKPHEQGDVALYRAEIDRIQSGEGYYQAAAAELTARGYPTRSVFNWRTPLPMWLLGHLPHLAIGKALLGGLALALVVLAFTAMASEDECRSPPPAGVIHITAAIGCALLLTGPLLPTVLGDLFVVPVLWAGVLMALSVSAYGTNRPYWGVAFGLAAVFLRELTLPYCLLCAAIACWHGRRREFSAWLLGLLAWLAFFAWHYATVSSLIGPDAHAHRESWLQFGGAGFVISIVQMNAFLLLVPQWVTALYLVAALVGVAGWNTPLGMRVGLSTCLFLVAFAIVGHSFNQYWGAMIAPLLCFGVARFPRSIRDLLHAAGWANSTSFACRVY